MRPLLALIILSYIPSSLAETFYKFVSSASFYAECDAEPQDERGPFGITLKEKDKVHDFLIMTGVYYDTCKDLEKRVNALRKKYKYILLIGSEGHVESPTNRVWRWRSVRSPQGNECISYFLDDCPHK